MACKRWVKAWDFYTFIVENDANSAAVGEWWMGVVVGWSSNGKKGWDRVLEKMSVLKKRMRNRYIMRNY